MKSADARQHELTNEPAGPVLAERAGVDGKR